MSDMVQLCHKCSTHLFQMPFEQGVVVASHTSAAKHCSKLSQVMFLIFRVETIACWCHVSRVAACDQPHQQKLRLDSLEIKHRIGVVLRVANAVVA